MNTGILYARMAITVLISLYTTRVILNALGAEDFGIFNVVGGAITMLMLLNTGMAAATQRFMSYAQGAGSEEKLVKIFNVSIFLHAAVALVAFVALQAVGRILFLRVFVISASRIDAAWLIYQFAAIGTLVSILSVPYDAVLNARENMLFFAVLGLIESAAKLVIAICIVKIKGDHLVFYGLWMAVLSALLVIARAWYCHWRYSECRFLAARCFDTKLLREMSAFAGWSFLGASSSLVAHYSQGLVLNTYFGTIVNAAQGVANQVSGQLGALASTMLRALNPILAKSEGAGDRGKMIEASILGSKLAFFLIVPLMVPVIIEMPYIFRLWLVVPPKYAVIFCRLLLLRNLIDQLFVTLPSAISAVGNIKRFQAASVVLNFAPLLGAITLFHMGYSAYWIYVSYIIYAVASSLLLLYFVSKDCGMSASIYTWRVVVRSSSSCILSYAMGQAIHSLLQEGFTRLVLVVLSSLLVFVVSAVIIGVTREERSLLWNSTVKLIGRVRLILAVNSEGS